MKIGLQFAMPAEFHALPGARDLSPVETISGVPFFEAAPGILACAGGVSKVNAAMAAEIFCLKYGVDLILNAGVAGCATDLPTGSLVVASEFVQHDVDTTAVGDPIGLVSTVNQVAFPTWEPERCVSLLKEQGVSAVTGRVATGDWFAVKGERAQWIRDTFSPTTCFPTIRRRNTSISDRRWKPWAGWCCRWPRSLPGNPAESKFSII